LEQRVTLTGSLKVRAQASTIKSAEALLAEYGLEAWMGGILGEEQIGTVKRQIAVNLVGGYLMKAPGTVFAACIHQPLRAHNVGLHKNAGVYD